MHIKSFLLSLLFIGVVLSAEKADLIVFSYDRPMQLYALLESVDKYIQSIGEIRVIYRASNDNFEKGYEIVQADYNRVIFHKQDNKKAPADFKQLTQRAFADSPSLYVLFAVDDIIVKDVVDLDACIDLLQKHNAYGFYLRLGLHITQCYSHNKPVRIPPLQNIDSEHGVYSWHFNQGQFDWGYPHTVDMTLFKKAAIKKDIEQLSYSSPNTFEDHWHRRAPGIMHCTGLCYKESKIVNLPLNKVQKDYNNRSMNLSAAELLNTFMGGKKIAIEPLKGVANKAPHMEYMPTFIIR